MKSRRHEQEPCVCGSMEWNESDGGCGYAAIRKLRRCRRRNAFVGNEKRRDLTFHLNMKSDTPNMKGDTQE